MSLFDRMMDRNMERAKKMQKRVLDMQEEMYNENGEQIERINKKSAELGAEGTKIHYKAAAAGVKEGLAAEKVCPKCGTTIGTDFKYCSECGAKQK
jgi:hypothetical protein